MVKQKILLSSACFPPIAYFMVIVNNGVIVIENAENYIKQTYRNRFTILSGNGLYPIIIPIEHSNHKMPIKEVCIDYKTNWNKAALKTLKNSYQNSPFFQYYIEIFAPFFNNKFKYLFDYNLEIITLIMKLLNINSKITFTNTYKEFHNNCEDLREVITPKNILDLKNPYHSIKPYSQVFDDRFGFLPNCSILDLIFNLGPESELYLTKNPFQAKK